MKAKNIPDTLAAEVTEPFYELKPQSLYEFKQIQLKHKVASLK